MADVLTLDELKQQNESEEQEVVDTLAPDDEEEAAEEPSGEESAEDESSSEEPSGKDESSGEKEGEEPSGEADEEEVPDWAKGEDEAAKYTDSDAANIRRKWKARLKEADEEKERLKARVEELEGKKQEPLKEVKRPDPNDYDTDEAYQEALVDYKFQVKQSEQESAEASRKKQEEQERQQKRIEEAVNGHYSRAAQLAEKSGIKPETYQAADLRVRQMVDSIYPDGGDAVTDALIAHLGEGSEKVMYHLGVNPSKLETLKEKFSEDRTGLAVAAYLGSLKTELDLPNKRRTAAPEPGKKVEGDAAASGDANLKRKYENAHKKGDTQAAFDVKRQAKQKGIDTSGW